MFVMENFPRLTKMRSWTIAAFMNLQLENNNRDAGQNQNDPNQPSEKDKKPTDGFPQQTQINLHSKVLQKSETVC